MEIEGPHCQPPRGAARPFHQKATCLHPIDLRALYGVDFVTPRPQTWGLRHPRIFAEWFVPHTQILRAHPSINIISCQQELLEQPTTWQSFPHFSGAEIRQFRHWTPLQCNLSLLAPISEIRGHVLYTTLKVANKIRRKKRPT